MTKVSSKITSVLLALIMVLGIMVMPVMPALEAEAAVTPFSYEWNFDNSSINPEAKAIGKYYVYNAETKEIENFHYFGYGELKNGVIGGAYDSYITAANNNDYGGKMRIVADDNGGKMLQLIHEKGYGASPYVAINFPVELTGVSNVEFEGRVRKMNADGTLESLTGLKTGQIFNTNGRSSATPWIGVSANGDSKAAVNNNYPNNVTCIHDGCTKKNSVIATNINNGNMVKYKLQYHYEAATPYANIYQNGADTPLTCGDHATKLAVNSANGTGLKTLYFTLPVFGGYTLQDGEAFVYDIDNIKVTPVPAAPVADIADGQKGVNVYTDKFSINFNGTVSDAEKDAVKLIDADGNQVATTNTINGTYVYVAPNAKLKPQAEYKLNIPAVEITGFGTTEEQVLTFYTAKDYAFGKATFDDDFEDNAASNAYLQKTFAYKANVDACKVGQKGAIGAVDGKYYVQSGYPTNSTTYSYTNINPRNYVDEIFHMEFNLNIPSAPVGTGWSPIVFMDSNGTSVVYLRMWETSMFFYVSTDGTWNSAAHNIASNSAYIGEWKYIVDINTKTGVATCQRVDPKTGVVAKTVTSTAPAGSLNPIKTAHILVSASNKIYSTTEEDNGTTYYINRVLWDDILIADMPIPAAKLATPSVGVSVDDAPVIEFNYPVDDVSNLELYTGETKVEDATFTLSPDGYSCTVEAVFEEATSYTVKLNGLTTIDGVVLADTIGFITGTKAPLFGINANVYAKADTAFATPLAALTADQEVTAVVNATNSETGVTFETIVYVGVYNADGNLLLATATKDSIKPGTQQVTSSFKVPAGADHIKVFAWDKYLTPYCVSAELFKK